jgi:hypothetical protein
VADLGTLLMKIKADNSDFQSKMQKVNKSLGGLKKAAKTGSIAVAAGGAALVGLATKSAASADEVDKMSQKIGISRDAYQEWAFALSQSGADVDGLQTGVKTLSKAAYEASQGVKTYSDSFDELGVSVTNADGSMKNQEQLLNETITALQGMEDETKRTALASELMGRSATELAPLLNAGADSAEAMKKQAHDLGLVLGDDVIDSGVVLTDTMDQIKRSFGAATTTIGASLMPAFQKFMDWVIAHMPEIKETVAIVFKVIEDIFKEIFAFSEKYLVPAFKVFWEWLEANMPQIKEIARTVFEKIVEVMEGVWKFINENLVPIFLELKDFWDQNGGTIKDTVVNVFDGIFSVVENVWDLLKVSLFPILEKVYNFIKDSIPLVAPVFDTAFNTIIDIINGVIDTIQSLIEWIDKAIEKFKNFFTQKNKMDSEERGVGGGTLGTSGGVIDYATNPTTNTNNNVNVNVNGTSDPETVAKSVVNVLYRQGVR